LLPREFNLGQILRDANILTIEDLEQAVRETGDSSLRSLARKEATWSSFKRLLTADLLPRRVRGAQGSLEELLERAGWLSAEQVGRVLEAIDGYGEGLGRRLVQSGMITESRLNAALARQKEEDRALWRVLVNTGSVDLNQICAALRIEDRILGQQLVTKGLLDVKTLQSYLDQATRSRCPAGRLLVQDEKIEPEAVARNWAELYNLPFRDLDGFRPDRDLIARFTYDQLTDLLVLPLESDADTLTLALAQPIDVATIKHSAHRRWRSLRVVFAPQDRIVEALRAAHERVEGDADGLVSLRERARIDPEDSPSEIVAAVMAEAYAHRGTAVHFDPGFDKLRIRMRVDGVLHDLVTTSVEKGAQVVARLKSMANLASDDRRRRLEGHLVARLGPELVDVRITTAPTRFGEKTVLHASPSLEVITRFAALGMSPDQVGVFQGFLAQPGGLVLCAGPPASGRTTTLYCALNQLNDPLRNLVTLEDPVEFSIPMANQLEISESNGLPYGDGLKALEHLDPDVLMFGEIRDAETARTAVRTAMSGVLVLAGIHAQDTVGAIDTLLGLGVSRYLLSNSLLGVTCQRLARRLCPTCSSPFRPDPGLLEELGFPGIDGATIEFHRGDGCGDCLGTGYDGRVGLFEVLQVTESMRRTLLRRGNKEALRAQALAGGMQSLAANALEKLKAGLTTPDEVLKGLAG
jgi:type IV pilus assembly protein PilB